MFRQRSVRRKTILERIDAKRNKIASLTRLARCLHPTPLLDADRLNSVSRTNCETAFKMPSTTALHLAYADAEMVAPRCDRGAGVTSRPPAAPGKSSPRTDVARRVENHKLA